MNIERNKMPLTQQQYFDRFTQLTERMVNTTQKKNVDYAEDYNAFANFEAVEYLTAGNIKCEHGIFTRMTDKVKRIASLMFRRNVVRDESLLDSLLDLAVYCLILIIWFEQTQNDEEKKDSIGT